MKRVAARLAVAATLAAVASCESAPEPAAIRVVAFGDSITEGVRDGVTRDQTFVAIVERRLREKGRDVRIVNAGVGGEETDEALERYGDAVLNPKPRLVTIMFGTNDSFVDDGKSAERIPLADFRRNLGEMVDRALAAGIRPVLMTEPRWGPRAINGLRENPNPRLGTYMEAVRELANERGVPLVDHFADWSAAADAGTDVGAWTVDQCHPNPEGQRRLADLLTPVLLSELGGPESGIPANVSVKRDLDYGGSSDPLQSLDLYLPRGAAGRPWPVVVFIHGGGWYEGDKDELVGMLTSLVADGKVAGASINYRLTGVAAHPAQIHDTKGALRWLKAHAADHGLDPQRVAVFGISAGGHLASLAGTSAGAAELEGTVGGNPDESSRVSCVVNFCGPSNFLTFDRSASRVDTKDADSIVGRLLGGPAQERQDVAKAASPVTYVSADDPPFLHIHGSADDVIPISQTREFDASLDAAGVSSTVLVGEGGGHLFWNDAVKERVRTFLGRCLLGGADEIGEGSVAIR